MQPRPTRCFPDCSRVALLLAAAACAASPSPAWRTATRGLPPELRGATALWQSLTLEESATGDDSDRTLASMVAGDGERWLPIQHLRVNDGFLVGIDRGEWGGALWWVRADGTEHRELAKVNVLAILGDGAGATVVTGLHHLTSSVGELLHVRADPAWHVASRTTLPGCPYAVAVVPSTGVVLAAFEQIVCWDGECLSPAYTNLAGP